LRGYLMFVELALFKFNLNIKICGENFFYFLNYFLGIKCFSEYIPSL